jgi:type VI protein secretion system component VasK
MDTNSYIVFLLLGVVLVGVDGQIIYRSGRRYLEESHGATEASASMTRLVTALFHLTVLGLLALITTIDFGGDNPTEAVIVRLGVVLLMLAIAHGITIGVLTKVRARQKREGLAEEMAEIRRDNARHNHQSSETEELRTPATPETPRSDVT